jgi:hypothetical protein
LVKSLSPEILAHVIDHDTTIDVWSTITSMFSSTSKYKASHLRTALNNTKKKYMTAGQYVTKMKAIFLSLQLLEKLLLMMSLSAIFYNGLDKSYNALVDRVQATPGIALDDLFGQLQAYDMRQTLLDEDDTDSGSFWSSANLAGRDGCAHGRSPDRDHGGYHGRSADRGGGDRTY